MGLYLLSYQLKKRSQIVWITFISNSLYVVQYLLLKAFAGAILDVLSTTAAFFAAKKHSAWVKSRAKIIASVSIAAICIAGSITAILCRDWAELLPIGGAVFQTVSLWCEKEQTLRLFGLCSAPFWLMYNLNSMAYGAAIGSLFAIISIIISLARYNDCCLSKR